MTTIMAERLNRTISNYVKEDQTGFIRGRSMRDNIRKLMNKVEKLQNNSAVIIVFLNTEKAFDQIEWTYLKTVMGKFGLRKYLETWLKLTYWDQKATLIMQGHKSRNITVG